MAHIVALKNGKNIHVFTNTDENLYKSLSYYIRNELGNEFYSYLDSYVRSLIEDNRNLEKNWAEAEERAGELEYEKNETIQIAREVYNLIIKGDLDSAKDALNQILNY